MMTMGTEQRTGLSPPDQAHMDRLDRLAHTLAGHGLQVSLLAPPGRGHLRGMLRRRQMVVLVVVGGTDSGRR
jgi:hypothetical protein